MRYILLVILVLFSFSVSAQAPAMNLGGNQGINVKRILAQDWMSVPIMSDTPVAPLTGSGWPGKGYLVFVARADSLCVGCPPNDTSLWEYTGARWKRVGMDYLTKLVYGGDVSQHPTINRRYIVSPYAAFLNGNYAVKFTNTTVNTTSKTADSTSRIDVIILTSSGPTVRVGTPKQVPFKPTVNGNEIELSTIYFPPFDTVPRFIPVATGVTSIFRVPGKDSIFYTIDTVTFAIKDSVGITKNDTTAMLNAYKFTAANGLTQDSTTFRLGGSLNQNTNLNLNSRRFTIIGGSDTTRFFSNGRLSVGGTPDSTFMLNVRGSARVIGGPLTLMTGAAATPANIYIKGRNTVNSINFETGGGNIVISDDFLRVSFIQRGSDNILIGRSSAANMVGITADYTKASSNIVIGRESAPGFTSNAAGNVIIGHYAARTSGTGTFPIGDSSYKFLLTGGAALTVGSESFNLMYGDFRNGQLVVNPTNGVDNPNINSSVQFAVNSTTRGFLQPRMNNTERNAISTPSTGLQVFSTTDSANYVYRGTGGGWQKIANEISGSATLDFGNTTAQNSADLTITVTGASEGDVVSLGVPNASVSANTCFTAWVSATDTVTVRFNNYSSGAVDPASGTFKVKVLK